MWLQYSVGLVDCVLGKHYRGSALIYM